MLRHLKTLLLTAFLAICATQVSAMFIQPDWLETTDPGVGTNRYAYSGSDPVNKMDPEGNQAFGDWGKSQEEADEHNYDRAEEHDQIADDIQSDKSFWGAVQRALQQDDFHRSQAKEHLSRVGVPKDERIARDILGAWDDISWGLRTKRGRPAQTKQVTVNISPPKSATTPTSATTPKNRSLSQNPFQGKTPEQIDSMLRSRNYVAKPNPEQAMKGYGSYTNTKTGRSFHVDSTHAPPKGPHVGAYYSRNHTNGTNRRARHARDFPM